MNIDDPTNPIDGMYENTHVEVTKSDHELAEVVLNISELVSTSLHMSIPLSMLSAPEKIFPVIDKLISWTTGRSLTQLIVNVTVPVLEIFPSVSRAL